MTRHLGPRPADEIGADLEAVWDRLAAHASAAPAAGPELTARVQGALLTEFDRTLRPVAPRPLFVVRPLFRPASLRSLLAAAALVALLGASVALAGAGVARLQQPPVAVPPPAAEESNEPDGDSPHPIVQAPAQPGPDGIEDPDEDDGDVDEDDVDDLDEDADDEDGADDTDEPEDDPDDEPSDSPDDSPDDSPSDDASDEPEANEPD